VRPYVVANGCIPLLALQILCTHMFY